jgi:N-acetylmuramic acid 6-phosphate (MurNAc-6-P) etherase
VELTVDVEAKNKKLEEDRQRRISKKLAKKKEKDELEKKHQKDKKTQCLKCREYGHKAVDCPTF